MLHGAQVPATPSGQDTDLLNNCMDAKHHKAKPGPEDSLHAAGEDGVGSGVGERKTPKKGEVRVVGRSALE